jgi:hypothetical protein
VRGKVLAIGGLAVIAVAVLTLLGAMAGSATARTLYVEHLGSFSFEAKLPTTDGYSMYLRGHGHRNVELDLGTEDTEAPYVTMTYVTRSHVGRHDIDANFGRFGRIDLHFAGAPKRSVVHDPACHPARRELSEYGPMVGSADFETLGGVVKLNTPHLRVEEGQVERSFKTTCKPQPREEFEGPGQFAESRPQIVRKGEGFVTTLVARGHSEGQTIDLYAFDLNHEFLADMAATSTRRFGGVTESTSVHAPDQEDGPGEAGKLSILGKGVRPLGATLSASAPFSGSATYRKQPGSPPTWLGSLAVEIPGQGKLSLAGPSFTSIVCAYAGRVPERECERTVGPPHEA